MAFAHFERQLYDMDYVKGGCQGDPPPGTNFDNTAGTYATNYAILVVGVLGTVAAVSRLPMPNKAAAASFFLLTGGGYGLAGYGHQFIQGEGHHPVFTISYVLVTVGKIGLLVLVNEMLTSVSSCVGTALRIGLNVMSVLVGTVVVYFIAAQNNMLLAGIFHGVCFLYALIVWAVMCKCDLVIGALLCAVGLAIQPVLAEKCGDPGYASCWKDCPLPAPYFNHNALFHTFFAVGLLVLAIGTLRMPPEPSPTQVGDRDDFERSQLLDGSDASPKPSAAKAFENCCCMQRGG